MVLPVSIWGTDTSGKAFHQLAYTLDISTGGARLGGVLTSLKRGDVIAVRYKRGKARFRVAWAAKDQVGIEYFEGERFIWVELPDQAFIDEAVVDHAPPREDVGTAPASAEPAQPGTEPAQLETLSTEEPDTSTGESTSTGDLATTLPDFLNLLHTVDNLVASAGMVEALEHEFHSAASHLRNTAWPIAQWIDQQDSGDTSTIFECFNAERVRYATQLCRDLARERQFLAAGASEESKAALITAVRTLATELGLVGFDGWKHASRGLPADRDPVALLAGLNDEIRSASLSQQETLNLVAEQARSFNDADGAAIALRDGDEMVAVASAGLAPLVGIRFPLSGGLVGEAIMARQAVVCCDAQIDERVDPTLCRNVCLRSSAIVPILSSDVVIGVVQVFACRPNAFDEAAASLLQHLAEMVAALGGDLRLQFAAR